MDVLVGREHIIPDLAMLTLCCSIASNKTYNSYNLLHYHEIINYQKYVILQKFYKNVKLKILY